MHIGYFIVPYMYVSSDVFCNDVMRRCHGDISTTSSMPQCVHVFACCAGQDSAGNSAHESPQSHRRCIQPAAGQGSPAVCSQVKHFQPYIPLFWYLWSLN